MSHGMVQSLCVAMLNVLDSYSNVTGTKNVAKEMKKITQGRVADRGKKWFPQLTDKRKRTVLYTL